MDALGKLLKRIPPKEQKRLLSILREVKNVETRKLLDIKKLSDGEHYRARKGNFRIIYHFKDRNAVIDSVRLRNEKTYREF
jgi:mRNA-degrading endonuclease RelE of RelBE toxin-antitoxin system